jgi:hypothetical protein
MGMAVLGTTVHECSAPFGGSVRAAFDLARVALVSQGFEILTDTDAELRASGPGMQSNRQPPIVGVSELQLRASGGEIVATATLGAVARLKAFVVLFPPLLVLSLAVVGQSFSWAWVGMIGVWLVVSPFMATAIERRTADAVDRMVRGMVQVGQRH